MEPPPPGSHHGYPDSVDSSPRSRNTDSWDDPLPPAPSLLSSKLRLMCSYGGHIVPRPHDKTLCYLGGDTRIVVVDRHASLADLSARLSRTLLDGRSFTLKYQLPNEDLDSLISVTTDEDLENMVEEYDRTTGPGPGSGSGSGKPSRLRLFLFPAKPDSAASSSIGSLLDDSKSETWFVDALNGAGVLPRGLSSDSNSVNCLLGLDDAVPASAAAADADPGLIIDSSSEKPLKQQEIHSVPDSPMMETASSFGSASSALGNLPPIRVHADSRAGIEEQFAAMMAAKAEEGNLSTNPPIPSAFLTAAAASAAMSPPGAGGEISRVLSEDERSDPGAGLRKPLPPPHKAVPNSDPVPRRVDCDFRFHFFFAISLLIES